MTTPINALSICIPTFNRLHYLKESLDVLLPQAQHLDVEVCVSDNCSTDGTGAYLNKMAEQFPCLRFFLQKENIGLEKNMLSAISKGKHNYILPIGDDEVLPDGTLELLLQEIDDQSDVIILDGWNTDDKLVPKSRHLPINIRGVTFSTPAEAFTRLWDKMPPGSFMAARQCFVSAYSDRFLGTSHAYTGAIWDSLADMHHKTGTCKIKCMSIPTVLLRGGEKSWRNDAGMIILYEIPLWFQLLMERDAYKVVVPPILNNFIHRQTGLIRLLQYRGSGQLDKKMVDKLVEMYSSHQIGLMRKVIALPEAPLKLLFATYEHAKSIAKLILRRLQSKSRFSSTSVSGSGSLATQHIDYQLTSCRHSSSDSITSLGSQELASASCMTNSAYGSPRVSILIPVFNRKQYIGECIESALTQTYLNAEIVVVDNASTDGTWEICLSYAARYPQLRTFRNDHNIGPVRNWKRCAEEARGEFSKILFSDDCLEANCLSKMVPKLDDPTVALVYCAVRTGEDRSHSVLTYNGSKVEKLMPRQFLDLVLGGGAAAMSPGAILIRTVDLIKNLHLEFPTRVRRSYASHGAGPDVMISLLTAQQYQYIANIPEPLVFFRAHAGCISIQNKDNQVRASYRSALSYYLKNSFEVRAWINYVAYIWLVQMKAERKWVNPQTHIRAHEGHGSLSELSALFFSATIHIIAKIQGSKFRFAE
jgi:glycosyltransferase involved in cell wall biosynthesis